MKKLSELGISPAPWKVRKENSGYYIANADDTGVASLVRYYSNLECIIADARLIAAAPELYDVCYRVQRWEDYAKAHNKAIEPWKDIMHDMRAALAKASGESEVRHA